MTLWPCASCGSTAWCAHREPELVEWAARVNAAAGDVADPLPPLKPPMRASKSTRTRVRKPPATANGGAA